MTATVQAVSRSTVHGFSKSPQPSIQLVPGEGVDGDAHRGRTTQHLYLMRRNPALPNLCQVHLFAAEMLAELASHGFAITPGQIGENLLTAGLDLLSLPLRTRLAFGQSAVVELSGLRTPCSKIDAFRPGLQKLLWGPPDRTGKKTRRAGVMGIVLSAGEVRAGDTIHVTLPALPHTPLGPV